MRIKSKVKSQKLKVKSEERDGARVAFFPPLFMTDAGPAALPTAQPQALLTLDF
jgi:hypothetical protein